MTGAATLVDDFARDAESVEDREHLAARLARKDRLRIKWGVDPTAPDIHLGHTVPMRALRRWQDEGHTPVIVIGDWTARIGDPTGRSVTRPPLTAAEVDANARTYLDQLFVILDERRTEVRRQTEWFDPMGLADVIRLATSRTVQQLLQRADFSERMAAERPISVHELLYPLLQGYDSVAVDADVEIGGTDQLFNLLAARDVQRHYGREEPQDVVTFPLLEGLDGVRKMSKSYDNYIGVAEPPSSQYGKAMSIPDPLIVRYMRLATGMPVAEVDGYAALLAADGVNPRDAKAALAASIVRQFHGEAAAEAAAEEFRRVAGGGGLPDDVPGVELAAGSRTALALAREVTASLGLQRSNADLKRLFRDQAVRLQAPGATEWRTLEADEVVEAAAGAVLRVGRRDYARLEAPADA
ncbi:MAG TPA: tyrosine--tRNA ligase [Candidatus Dormibacteraeota bacterium]|nr:tyrosine--tRNA ligase [Candidatus Dormibacteraeota bacterium]